MADRTTIPLGQPIDQRARSRSPIFTTSNLLWSVWVVEIAFSIGLIIIVGDTFGFGVVRRPLLQTTLFIFAQTSLYLTARAAQEIVVIRTALEIDSNPFFTSLVFNLIIVDVALVGLAAYSYSQPRDKFTAVFIWGYWGYGTLYWAGALVGGWKEGLKTIISMATAVRNVAAQDPSGFANLQRILDGVSRWWAGTV